MTIFLLLTRKEVRLYAQKLMQDAKNTLIARVIYVAKILTQII